MFPTVKLISNHHVIHKALLVSNKHLVISMQQRFALSPLASTNFLLLFLALAIATLASIKRARGTRVISDDLTIS